MKRICEKFQNSILFFIRSWIYLGGFLIFFGLLGIENRQVRVLSRTSIMMAAFYIFLMLTLTFVYGGANSRFRLDKAIFQTLSLSLLITDTVAYGVFLVMSVNDANNREFRFVSFPYFILSIALQMIWTFLLVKLSGAFWNYVTPPERTLLVMSELDDSEKVRKAINSFGGRYKIWRETSFDASDIHEMIRDSDAVFFYEVPAGAREELINYCYKHLINIYLNPDLADVVRMTSRQMMFSDLPFLSKEFGIMTFEQRIVKRSSDILLSCLALIVLSPVLIVSALAIKLDDRGPVFFKQRRATIHGRVFEIYKFRTMRVNVENHSAEKGDTRITKAGKILRKYRIDELPQLINIIKGDMSIVGPRPEMLENVTEYEKKLPEFKYRLRMKAGLTGLAQVLGRYNTSSRDKLILDLMYIENFSLSMDLKIIFQTLLVLMNAEDSTEGF